MATQDEPITCACCDGHTVAREGDLCYVCKGRSTEPPETPDNCDCEHDGYQNPCSRCGLRPTPKKIG